METVFIGVLVILFIAAISDLIVGVSNDAVNFLNSAIGAKAASFKVIMVVAAAGVLAGALFSDGMMEVARKGIFHPGEFYFEEIMFIFLAVMMTDILLLDLFNTFGLPTSTTVSIVFEILGAAFGMALIKVYRLGLDVAEVGKYINNDKALAIIAGILLSIFISFTAGAIIQYIVRMGFSFHFEKPARYLGALFSGLGITAITYFLLVKGAKHSSFIAEETALWIKNNTGQIILYSLLFWTVFSQLLKSLFKVNILKVVVLAGTFSLAMAFAGNDLVNFIGVPLAGLASFKAFIAAPGADPSTFSMEVLAESVKTPTYLLVIAGLVMVVTLWLSKKARSVTQTTIDLSRQDEGTERFQSSVLAKILVRMAVYISQGFSRFIPFRLKNAINARFRARKNQEDISFDLIRASVNLIVASILISIATSMKLPLSTTYVTFMVAMGTSLADRAWGRESAVYRITGVVTVIGGWFLTAISAFVVAFVMLNLINWGGVWAIGLLVFLIGFMVYRTYKMYKKKQEQAEVSRQSFSAITGEDVVQKCKERVSFQLTGISAVYQDGLRSLMSEKRKILKQRNYEGRSLLDQIIDSKNNAPDMMAKVELENIETGHHYVEILDYLHEATRATKQLLEQAFKHVDNNHKPLLKEQRKDLEALITTIKQFIDHLYEVHQDNAFERIDELQQEHAGIIKEIKGLRKKQIKLVKGKEVGTRNSMLSLMILSESQNMIDYLLNAIKAEALFIDRRPHSSWQ